MKNRVFLSENIQFLDVKFSIYLNRHVFVMLGLPRFPSADSKKGSCQFLVKECTQYSLTA